MEQRRFMSTGSSSSLFRDFDDDDFDEYRCLNRIGNRRGGSLWTTVRRREMMTSTTLKEENVLENDDDFFDDETKKKNATKTPPPSLRTRMRHLTKLVHPDVLGPNVPKECKDNNQSALAELNGVLDSITKEKKFPKTGVKRLKFYYVGSYVILHFLRSA